MSRKLNRRVTHRLAASDVKVPQFVAKPCDLLDPNVSDLLTLGYGEVSEVGPKFPELTKSSICHLGTVRDAQLSDGQAVRGQVLDADVWKKRKKDIE